MESIPGIESATKQTEEEKEEEEEVIGERVSAAELKSRFELDRDRSGNFFELGVGAYGQVLKARDKMSESTVAIKLVEKKSMAAKDIQSEVEALRIARMHPNVVKLVEILDCAETNTWYIVTELCQGGELFDRLIEDGPYGEGLASRLVSRIVGALHHIHSHDYVHLDIKPENMVFHKPKAADTDGLDIRIVDFGMARRIDPACKGFTLCANVGTTAYWSPEMLQPFYDDSQDGNSIVFNNKRSFPLQSDPRACDMWAVGVILFILLLGCHPFDPEGTATEGELARRIIKGERASTDIHGELKVLSPEVKQLIEGMLERDPKKRLSAQQVLEHPWIQKHANATSRLDEQDTEGVIAGTSDRLKGYVAQAKSYRLISTALLYAALVSVSAKYNGERRRDFDFLQRTFAILDPKNTGKVDARSVRALLMALQIPNASQEDCDLALNFDEFVAMIRRKYTQKFRRGDAVFKKGDEVKSMYIILSGSAQIEYTGAKGSIRPVSRLFPGDVFGETALLDGRNKRNATVRCSEDMEVVFWSPHDFISAMSGSKVLEAKLDEIVFHRQNIRAKAIIERMIKPNVKCFAKGSVLFNEGDHSDSLYLIQSGNVEASVVCPQAHSNSGSFLGWLSAFTYSSKDKAGTLVKNYGPGDIIGTTALIGAKRYVTATCTSNVEVVEVTQEELKKIMEEPSLRQNLLRLSRRMSEAAWSRKSKQNLN